jgi:hypothetical protein
MARQSSHDLAGRARALGAHRRLNNKETVTHMKARRISSMTLASLAVALAAVVLAACGSSSSSTTATQSASAAASSSGGGAGGNFASRFSAYRECMQKQGITLPQRKPGQPGQPGGGVLGGGAGGTRQLPAGVTRAQYEAAQQKCASLRPHFRGGAEGRSQSPMFKAALVKFSACMRENGIALPAPNTSGKGPVFSTTGINTTSTQFKTAQSKCAALLRQGFSRPQAGGPPGEGTQAG